MEGAPSSRALSAALAPLTPHSLLVTALPGALMGPGQRNGRGCPGRCAQPG